ncbi:MAG TPA: response regulator [Candidatus Acidoferrum sp.]
MSVLVADTNIMRRAIVLLLRDREGIQVIGEASTLSETLEKTAELHPDVIVLDLHIPEKEGLGQKFNARVLATSLNIDDESKILAESIGAETILDKMDLADCLVPTILGIAPAKLGPTHP